MEPSETSKSQTKGDCGTHGEEQNKSEGKSVVAEKSEEVQVSGQKSSKSESTTEAEPTAMQVEVDGGNTVSTTDTKSDMEIKKEPLQAVKLESDLARTPKLSKENVADENLFAQFEAVFDTATPTIKLEPKPTTPKPKKRPRPKAPSPKTKRIAKTEQAHRKPAARIFSPTVPSPPESRGYDNRKNAGRVERVYNEQAMKYGRPSTKKTMYTQAVEVQSFDPKNFFYMHTPVRRRAIALEQRLLLMEKALVSTHALPELTPVGIVSQKKIVHVGRICCDAPTGKLNAKSVMLEGSMKFSGGRRLQLDLSKLPSFSIFPGQIVAVEGLNTVGRSLVVEKLFSGAPLPLPKTDSAELKRQIEMRNGHPISIWAANGPFTTSDNLDFLPLADLFEAIDNASSKPDVLVLNGPFVSATHPTVMTGDVSQELGGERVEMSFEDLFQLTIAEPIRGWIEDNPEVNTTIVLAPSTEDVFHHLVFPQPALDSSLFVWPDEGVDLVKDKRVLLLSNPGMFQVGEVLVSTSSTDVLHHVLMEETSRETKVIRLGRMARGARSLIQQRSMYPLFPAREGTPLDLAHLSKAGFNDRTPDIILLRSKLNYFALEVNDVVCVNPGHTAKGSSGGTYAKIMINPMKIDDKVKHPLPHDIKSRAWAQIVRV